MTALPHATSIVLFSETADIDGLQSERASPHDLEQHPIEPNRFGRIKLL